MSSIVSFVTIDQSSLDVGRPRESSPGPATDKQTLGDRSGKRLEALGEAAGVALLGPGQGLQPLGDLLEALLAGGLGEARVHLGVLVGLALDGRLQVVGSLANGD